MQNKCYIKIIIFFLFIIIYGCKSNDEKKKELELFVRQVKLTSEKVFSINKEVEKNMNNNKLEKYQHFNMNIPSPFVEQKKQLKNMNHKSWSIQWSTK